MLCYGTSGEGAAGQHAVTVMAERGMYSGAPLTETKLKLMTSVCLVPQLDMAWSYMKYRRALSWARRSGAMFWSQGPLLRPGAMTDCVSATICLMTYGAGDGGTGGWLVLLCWSWMCTAWCWREVPMYVGDSVRGGGIGMQRSVTALGLSRAADVVFGVPVLLQPTGHQPHACSAVSSCCGSGLVVQCGASCPEA